LQRHHYPNKLPPGLAGLDKLLTWFVNLWFGFAAFLGVIDIGWTIITAPTIWSGIWMAQEKWFDPFNVVHFHRGAYFRLARGWSNFVGVTN
jgi:hypothetical protein